MPRVLVIGQVWPEPSTTAAGNHMLQLLHLFLKQRYTVTFGSTAARTEYSEDLGKLGVTQMALPLNDSNFDAFVAQWQPEVVVFDRFMVEEQFGWRVAKTCPKALRILNTEDVHSLRKFREYCHQKKQPFTVEGWKQQDITLREVAAILRSDLTLVVSLFEMQLLQQQLGLDPRLFLHLPFLLPKINPEQSVTWPSFEERIDFITYGNGRHAPNVDAVKWLKEELWPNLRQRLPEAKLQVYGAYLPQQLVQMHDPKQGFMVNGWAPDLTALVKKARVVLAPLRFGAGIKGKLSTAMQCGTPSVTTAIGAEGMAREMSWAGFVANESAEICHAAVTLYTQKEEWLRAQEHGIAVVNTLYDGEFISDCFTERIKKMTENLDQHRTHNLMGRLLEHQNYAASKFMGKWIEAKNKREP